MFDCWLNRAICFYCECAEQHVTSSCSSAVLFSSAQADNSWDEVGSATTAAAGQVLLAQLWGTSQVPSLALKAFDQWQWPLIYWQAWQVLFGSETALAADIEVLGCKREVCSMLLLNKNVCNWFISGYKLAYFLHSPSSGATIADHSETHDFNSSFYKSRGFQKNDSCRMEIGANWLPV